MSEVAALGMLDEHAPRNTEHGQGGSYEPTPEEKKAIKLANRVYERNKKHRAQYDTRWTDFYRFFRGKQWKEQRPSFRNSEVINFIWRTIQSTVPIQADPKPKFDFLPREPSDFELAKIVGDCAGADWTKNNWGLALLEVLYDANIYGTAHSEMCVRENPLTKTQDIVFESTDNYYCFPDPDATDVNVKAETFVHAEPMDVRKVKKKYPKVAEWLKPDLIDLMSGSKTDFAPYKFRSPIDNKVVIEGAPSIDLLNKERVLVVTTYLAPGFCDDEVIEVERDTVDPESGETSKLFEKRAKYPNGRKIVVANGVLCEDDPRGLPFDDMKFPHQKLQNYVLPREYWGVSEIEQIEGPQKIFNKVVNFVLDVLALTGNPIWINPANSGVEDDQLVNRTGLVVPTATREDAPYRVEGSQLQPYVFQLIDKLAEWFDSISGSQDVTRGVQPTGVTAASAISNLQEAAQTRIRLKSRILDYYLQNVGQQYASRFFQFKTAPEVYRLTNSDGAAKYFKAHVEDYEKKAETPVTGADGQPMLDPETQQPVMAETPTGEMGRRLVMQPYNDDGTIAVDQLKTYEIRAELDLTVSTGSSLPFAKAEKEAQLRWMFQDGIIDAEEVLKGLDYPNYQAVLGRMQQAAQMKAQQEAAMKAPPGAPPAAA